MPLKDGRNGESADSNLWMLLCPLFCYLVMARGSTLSPDGLQSIAATSLPEDWLSTTVQLQPDLETEAQTLTEAPTEGQADALTEAQTEALTVAPTEAQTEALTEVQTQIITNNYTGLSCVPVIPPRRGSFYVESGTGVSIGSVLAFWCREGYQLVGSDKIYCHVRSGKAQWSNYLPVCEAIPRPEDRGLRVAVLASVVSGIVIFAMSLSFLICCLQERSSRDRGKKDRRSRRREKQSARRSECWLEREEGEWEAFPPPKIFHLSQRMNPRLAPDSPLYLTGGLNGYENRGYQRSQESLLKASFPGLYRSESQLYPHVVLQRVPTPTAPSAPSAPSAPLYLQLPPSSSSATSPAHTTTQSQPRIMTQYPTPTYPPIPNTAVPVYPHPTPAPIYPNPNPPPQRPWQ
ncbi:uncharacterized protein PAE49_008831 isoform 1-T2 [Odontesthes bonariensis]|uniref:uncharacterized protein LOC142385869 isoform X1 n=1 Tax=Odontesthes bonariensis TaxID=219752 RepID=UPI003F582658